MSEFEERPLSETLVEDVKNELSEMDTDLLDNHAQRYEDLHNKLTEALSSIEGM